MKVYIAIYTTGWVRKELSLALIKWLYKTEHNVYIDFVEEEPNEHARNSTVKRFLESDNEYFLQIDNDVLPQKNPLDLVDLMKKQSIDILSCPVYIYQHKLFLNIYKYDENNEYLIPVDFEKNKNAKLIEIDSTGTGIILCSRRALERVERPFERIYDDKGIASLGLDLAFSQKAKKAGFKIFSHLDFISKHYKVVDLSIFVK
jgi:hypothetical protein